MKKVYILTTGDYSDYRIEGVYSSSEKAEEASRLYTHGTDTEEYDIDPDFGLPKGHAIWYIKMNSRGDALEAKQHSPNSWNPGHPFRTNRHDKIAMPIWCFIVSARDKEHAVKIASEKRREMMASGEWVK